MSTPSVLGRVSREQRFTRNHPCPICGGWDNGTQAKCWGYVSSDGTHAHCTRAELAGQLTIGPDDAYHHRLDGDCRCGRRHGGGVTVPPRLVRPRTPEPAPPPLDTLDRVYRRYLQLNPLRPEHLAFYLMRGAEDAEAAEVFGYGSLPYGAQAACDLWLALCREFGRQLMVGVPGFDNRGVMRGHFGNADYDAAVIPGRDDLGRIVGLLRHTTHGDRKKYLAFANTTGLFTFAGLAPGRDDLRLIEGIHKANVAAVTGGIRALGLSGLTLPEGAKAAIRRLNPTRIGYFADVDKLRNPRVLDAEARLMVTLRQLAVEVTA